MFTQNNFPILYYVYFTGEFEFQCNKCHQTIMQVLHKSCKSTSNERINGPYTFINNVLYGFVCRLQKCNYIQLSKKNLLAHLENMHHVLSDDKHMTEIILLKVTQPTDIVETRRYSSRSMIESKEEMCNASIDLTLSDDEQCSVKPILADILPAQETKSGHRMPNRVAAAAAIGKYKASLSLEHSAATRSHDRTSSDDQQISRKKQTYVNRI